MSNSQLLQQINIIQLITNPRQSFNSKHNRKLIQFPSLLKIISLFNYMNNIPRSMNLFRHNSQIFKKILFWRLCLHRILINHKNPASKFTFLKFFLIFISNYIFIPFFILPKRISPHISMHIKKHSFLLSLLYLFITKRIKKLSKVLYFSNEISLVFTLI